MTTKLGVHVTFGARNGYGDVVAAAPAAVTAVGEGGALVEAKDKSNGRTITIFREQTVFFDAPNGIDQMTTAQARQTADDNWPALKAAYQLNPADYYQVTNETGGDNPQSLANIAAFETRLMELAERDGFKLAIASPAGGSPGIWENWVTHFVPLIRRAGLGGHIYSRHAYGGVAPEGNGFLTKVENGNIVPADANAGRPFEEARFLREQGILTPMVLTEVGPKGGFNFPGTAALVEDAARYDQLCQAHENIWAFCIFTYGQFQNANIQDASAALADYLGSQGGAVRPVYPVMDDTTNGGTTPVDNGEEEDTAVTQPDFIPFDSPVGTEIQRRSQKIYPSAWLDANPFKTHYTNPTTDKEAFHTGSDLNLPGDLDKNAPIFAAADGEVTFAGNLNVWGNVIVIKHADVLFSRYGHVQNMLVAKGDTVSRGQHIASVGQDAGGGPFHLHFDISTTAVLETKPWHWPGLDLDALEANYVDPADYIRNHRPPMQEGGVTFLWVGRVTATDGLNLRTEASDARGEATVIRGLNFGSQVKVLAVVETPASGKWYRVQADDEEGFVFARWVERLEEVITDSHRSQPGDSTSGTGNTNGSSPSVTLEFGIHNEDGADWMRDNGVRGWSLHAIALGTNGTSLDMTRFKQAGIKMLVRLNFGFHPDGNIPLPSDSANFQGFVQACVQTMQQSKGVWGFILGNETNNPNEWPNGTPITAPDYVDLYNQVWLQKPDGVRLGPQAVDPYFGPDSDNREYWRTIMTGITGADFLTVHPKTQDSNPDNVDSDMMFGNDPLRWQFFHLRSYQPLVAVIPSRFSRLPLIATEVNPQRKDGGELGWEPGRGAIWVQRAAAHFQQYNTNGRQPISGVIFYRFSADEWAINDRPAILNAVKAVAA